VTAVEMLARQFPAACWALMMASSAALVSGVVRTVMLPVIRGVLVADMEILCVSGCEGVRRKLGTPV
jgi:hypothetical protein